MGALLVLHSTSGYAQPSWGDKAIGKQLLEEMSNSKVSERDDICPSGLHCTAEEGDRIADLTSQARADATRSLVALGIGITAIVGGVALILTAPPLLVGALSNSMPPQVSINDPRRNLNAVPAGQGGLRWIYSENPVLVQHMTVDTPVLADPDKTCGRVIYSDFHVANATNMSLTFPAECPTIDLTPQEKILEFMLFDLASCIGEDRPPPPPPPAPPPPPPPPPRD